MKSKESTQAPIQQVPTQQVPVKKPNAFLIVLKAIGKGIWFVIKWIFKILGIIFCVKLIKKQFNDKKEQFDKRKPPKIY